jgi:dTDP-glucose 4,6-dehydratase
VEDTCAGVDAVLHAPVDRSACEVYNLGTGRAVSVESIAEMVCDMVGVPRDLITHIGDRPGQVTKHIADSSKVLEKLGWSAAVGFEEGLERTVEWYRANEEWWRKLEWMKVVPVRLATGEIQLH